MERDGKFSASNSGATRQMVGDGLEIASAGNDPGNSFSMRWTGGEFAWVETGLLDLSGPLIGSGTQWYLPRPDRRMMYCSQFYLGEGTLLGTPVWGFLGFDQVYLPQGVRLYVDDPWAGEQPEGLELAWYTWGTRYTDGSWEVGQFAAGHGRSGVAFISTSDGAELSTTDITVEVTTDGDGYWAHHVDFRVGG